MSDSQSGDTASRLTAIEEKLAEMTALLQRLEAKVDQSLGVYDAMGSIVEGVPPRLVAALHSMTPSEHVALQMVVDGRINREIAVCLDVTDARVQEWVASVVRKLDLGSRAEIRKVMAPVLSRLPAAEYEKASGGIPKDWNDKYGVPGIPDPYRQIYHPG